MSRISTRLQGLRAEGGKALAVFLTAGVPTRNATVRLVLDLEAAGADVIEIGLPFSDPLADGPVIQQSSALALRNGVTLRTVLEIVGSIRKRSDLPIALMGYLNPLLRYGIREFCAAAAGAGVDGMILPEVPLEEHLPFGTVLRKTGLDSILLVTPGSSAARIRAIDRASRGFLYCVSITGVTGARIGRMDEAYLNRVTGNARNNPVLAGFGIASPAEARMYARHTDGVIVGSAFVRRLLAGEAKRKTMTWISEIKAGVMESAEPAPRRR